jgi:hypothetical protein
MTQNSVTRATLATASATMPCVELKSSTAARVLSG